MLRITLVVLSFAAQLFSAQGVQTTGNTGIEIQIGAGGGSGSSGIASINTDSTSAQSIAGATPIMVSTVSGTTTISLGTVTVGKGGTNSATALSNNRFMVSSGGAIVEASALTASRALVSDTNGLPSASAVTATQLYGANGGDGNLDEVGLWNRILTSGERTAVWNGGAGAAYPF